MESYTVNEYFWLGVGLGGQLLFGLRVANQWWISERAGKCVVPALYWSFGLSGGICLIAYGIYRLDPVILVGQLFGSVISYRNMVLSRSEKSRFDKNLRNPQPEEELWPNMPASGWHPKHSPS